MPVARQWYKAEYARALRIAQQEVTRLALPTAEVDVAALESVAPASCGVVRADNGVAHAFDSEVDARALFAAAARALAPGGVLVATAVDGRAAATRVSRNRSRRATEAGYTVTGGWPAGQPPPPFGAACGEGRFLTFASVVQRAAEASGLQWVAMVPPRRSSTAHDEPAPDTMLRLLMLRRPQLIFAP